MRLIINLGLSDKVVLYHIAPIAEVKNVDEIYIIRDRSGPSIKKVRYYYPPAFVGRLPLVKEIYKLLLTLVVSVVMKPDLFLSFILFPHGFITLFSSIILRKPAIVSLLNGKAEVYSVGTRDRSMVLGTIPPIGFVLIAVLKRFTYVTVTGSRTRNFLIENGLDPERIRILPHVPMAKPLIYEEKIYDCIYVGRLTRIKHVEVMIKAIGLVKRKLPKVTAVILGDGVCREALEHLAFNLGLVDNVTFLGHVNYIDSFLRRSKLLALCSEREGLPFAILEAFNYGIPVITSDCGDITDIAKHNLNSIIINNHKDHNAYAGAILKLLLNEPFYRNLKFNAYKDFKDLENKAKITWTKIFFNLMYARNGIERKYRNMESGLLGIIFQ